MTELDLEAERARVGELRGQADEVLASLRARLDAVGHAQATALRTTGEATSRDGSVRAVVDATGVVTALVFAQSAFDRGTPETLAQATVATIQAAAAKARAEVARTLAPVRTPGAGILAAAARAFPELSPDRLTVPEVPHTAVDPADEADPWPRAEPTRATPHRPLAGDDSADDESGSVLRGEDW
jgi:DNA-binding protein YbaB